MKKILLAGIGGVILATALVSSVVLAGSSPASIPNMQQQATAVPPTQPKAWPRQGMRGMGMGVMPLMTALTNAVADLTGLTPKEVLAELHSGKSLAQIAQEHGKTSDAVIQAARTKLQDRLKQAVANGRMQQTGADALLAEFDRNAATLVAKTDLMPQGGGMVKPFQGRQGARAPMVMGLIQAAAEVTGLSPKELLAELHGGKSLAQIAQEHGKTGDDILAKMREQGQQRLDQALERAKEQINQPGLGSPQPDNAPQPTLVPNG